MSRRVIVAGPPCAGKSTYVNEHASPDDLILDRDEIARSLGSAGWDHPEPVLDRAERIMQDALRNLPPGQDVWIVRTLPDAAERESLASSLGAEVVLLDVSADEARRRAAKDGRPGWTAQAISQWWERHTQTTPQPHGTGANPHGRHTMSDTTVTPADVTPKPAGPAQAPKAGPAPDPKADDNIDWKAEARKWEQRAKDNKAAAETASKTEAEKVADRLAEVEKRAADAEARVTRRDIALEHKLSKDDAALLDSLTDEAAMKALAARLSVESGRPTNNVVPREGNTPQAGGADGATREFVRGLFGSTD